MLLTFEQCTNILDAYYDFYPDDKIDIKIYNSELQKDLNAQAKGKDIDKKKEYCGDEIIQIMTYYPELTLTNDNGKHYTVYGIYVNTTFPKCCIYMGRTIYNSNEVASGYRHSHINTATSHSFSTMSDFCRGNNDTPINEIRTSILEATYNNFSLAIQSFIIETERMIRIESNEGIPYISFEDIGKNNKLTPIFVYPIKSGYIENKFANFILYYCSLGLDKFYYDGRNWQLDASDTEFITRVSNIAKKYKFTKNLSIFQDVYFINGLYYPVETSTRFVPERATANWSFKGKYPPIIVTDKKENNAKKVAILKGEYLDVLYNFLLNLINGIYATNKYKDCVLSRAYKIKTALIKGL